MFRDPRTCNRRFRYFALLIAFGLSLVAASAAQTPSGSIVGEVLDHHGTPLPGARVSVSNTGTGATVNVATDAGGHFAVEQVAHGDYRVTVASSGFESKELKVTVKPGGKTKVHIRLKIVK